jgi:hypothetical protein
MAENAKRFGRLSQVMLRGRHSNKVAWAGGDTEPIIAGEK